MFRGTALLLVLLFAGVAAGQEPGVFPGSPYYKPARLPVLGATPVPTAKNLEDERRFIAGVVDPQNTLDMIAGRPRVILLKATPTRTLIADTSVMQLKPIEPDGTQLIVMGLEPGITVMNLWFRDPQNQDKDAILSFYVRVLPDPEAKERRAAAFKALETEVNGAFPNSRVRLNLVGDKVIMSGQAHDIRDAGLLQRVTK